MLFRPNRHLSLRTFVPTKANQSARSSGIQFIGALRPQPNLLIIAGRSKSGKSHLMHALGNYAKHNESIRSIACMSATQFIEQVAKGNRYGDLQEVLERISAVDLLSIDDTDQIYSQPIVADALLSLLRQREKRGTRTLLAVTMNEAPPTQHALIDFLDKQAATRLI